jgi:hypothetical protein
MVLMWVGHSYPTNPEHISLGPFVPVGQECLTHTKGDHLTVYQ